MEIIESFADLRRLAHLSQNWVICLGNFDGMHLGHQKLISEALAYADLQGCRFLAISFCPHTRLFFNPQIQSFLITSDFLKKQYLKNLKVPFYFEISFNQHIASMSAKDFFDYLIQSSNLNISTIFLGHDFSFGSDKIRSLQTLSQTFDLEWKMVDPYKDQISGQVISSTLIRSYINKGDLSETRRLLGRDFNLEGKVIHGHKRGQKIGIKTANIVLDKSYICPQSGVYITKVQLCSRKAVFPAITNIGVNPTFDESHEVKIETHILSGFDQDIYDQQIEISFIKKIREEIRFDSVDNLKQQILSDIEIAEKYHAQNI